MYNQQDGDEPDVGPDEGAPRLGKDRVRAGEAAHQGHGDNS